MVVQFGLWNPNSKKKLTTNDIIFDELFILIQNEAHMCNDIPKEKLTIEVEFNENSSPFHKSDDEMTHKLYCKDSLFNCNR